MEVNPVQDPEKEEDSPLKEPVTYVIPIICKGDTCDVALDQVTVEGEEYDATRYMDLIPGDWLKFVLGDADLGTSEDNLEAQNKYAGSFAIVAVVNKDLVNEDTQFARVEKDSPGLIQINPNLMELYPDLEEGSDYRDLLKLILYCESCYCNYPPPPDPDVEYEKENTVYFYVGPRPRKKRNRHPVKAAKRSRSRADQN